MSSEEWYGGAIRIDNAAALSDNPKVGAVSPDASRDAMRDAMRDAASAVRRDIMK